MLMVLTILWVVIWLLTLVDLFGRPWSLTKKLLWALAMLVLPVVGVIAYFIVRPAADSDVHGVVPRGDQSSEGVRDRHPV